MENIKKHYRHGDVSFHRVSQAEYLDAVEASDNKTLKRQDVFVVALGEVTGHKHVMTMEKPRSLSITALLEGNNAFELKEEGTMTHEEHHAITMAPGFYIQKIERDFDPFSQRARIALD